MQELIVCDEEFNQLIFDLASIVESTTLDLEDIINCVTKLNVPENIEGDFSETLKVYLDSFESIKEEIGLMAEAASIDNDRFLGNLDEKDKKLYGI